MTRNQRASAARVIDETGEAPLGNHAFGVLVVDDDPSIRRLMQQILSDSGYAVSTASDGQEALADVARRRPDLVISDLQMPRLNGVELVDALRSRHPTIPILVVSASVTIAIADVPVLAKPFAGAQLLEAVRALLVGTS